MIDIAERIERAWTEHGDRSALVVDSVRYTYRDLQHRVLAMQRLIESVAAADERLIGVGVGDSIESYAAVLAVLRSGRGFVPINPDHPTERNARIVEQARLRTVIEPHREPGLRLAGIPSLRVVVGDSASVDPATDPPRLFGTRGSDLAYLLFTSGSTGEPKGVPITRLNLSTFLDAFAASGCAMHPTDRVLQMFDLTFDFSIATYLAPFASGACVYTVSPNAMKFAEAYRLLAEERLTVAPVVPSLLSYLRPYFEDIHLPELRLSLFCGEALRSDAATAWARCAPRSAIVNFYGPTEATVFAMYYRWRPANGDAKSLNGVVSIGQPMVGTRAVVVNDDLAPVTDGVVGELCLSGDQLMPGYWNDPARTARSFFAHAVDGAITRFYRTGDLAIRDAAGDYLFCGRLDHQVKVQGFRVELGEIEHHVRELIPECLCVVVPHTNQFGAIELQLIVEQYQGDLKAILASLRARLPSYMVPARALSSSRIPLTDNGTVDRLTLAVLGRTNGE
jgi:D-alanine--poly(phosphoribitol) ligase subunit 1